MNATRSRFPIPDLAGLPADVRARILAVQEKDGGEYRLNKAECEMIVGPTSAARRPTIRTS